MSKFMKPTRHGIFPVEEPEPTDLERSTVEFVAQLAKNVDAQRGIAAQHGTRETQAKVITIVKEAFFK